MLAVAVAAGCQQHAAAPAGDAPDRPSAAGGLTFARDIAPIVFESCSSCHRPGEAAPFSLLGYDDVRRRARQIVRVTRSRFMPPWAPTPGRGEFVGERRLSEEQIGLIARWVDEGLARGDDRDLPPVPPRVEGWRLGEPDLVLTMSEPYEVPAEGTDVYRNFVFPAPVPAARWVRAVEFRPGRPATTLHHATLAVDPTPSSRYHDGEDPLPGFDGMINSSARRPDGHLLGWVPGKSPYVVDESIAWRLAPGSDIVAQLHMRPTGKSEPLSPVIGLHFSDRPAERTPFLIRLGSRTIDIPPGEREHVVTDTFVLPVAVEALGVVPHAHDLAREMEARAALPDGSERWLIHIADWDFDWQDEYRYVDPLHLPAGTTISMRYTYDNSAGNPRNPHEPPRRVVFGPDTTDEMADLWLQVLPTRPQDLPVLERDFSRKEARANIAAYRRLLTEDGTDVSVRHQLAVTLASQGAVEEALDELRRVFDRDPHHVPAHVTLGQVLYERDRPAAAAEHFRAALAWTPDMPEVSFNLGQALHEAGHPERAEAAYRDALRSAPGYAPAHYRLGVMLQERGRTTQAAEHYRRAIATDPGHAGARNNLGGLLAAAGDLDGAIAHLERALAAEPSHAGARTNLARAEALRSRRRAGPR